MLESDCFCVCLADVLLIRSGSINTEDILLNLENLAVPGIDFVVVLASVKIELNFINSDSVFAVEFTFNE